MRSSTRLLVAVGLAASLTGACVPAPGASSRSAAPSAPPKVITLADRQEPDVLVPGFGQSGVQGEDTIWHRHLTTQDRIGSRVAGLAAGLISEQAGTWRLNADGSMDTIWAIRPNLTWHDGTPFTSADLAFAWRVYKAPEASPLDGTARPLMESAVAVDPLILAIHWSAVYVNADKAPNLTPLPRHLLEDRFDRGWDVFTSSPALGPEFVGLGPYRVTHWEPGSHIEFEAFDRYYLGRPQIDRVILRFIGDPNTMIANLLAGAIDVISGAAVYRIAQAMEADAGAIPASIRVSYSFGTSLSHIEFQLRPEYARPRDGLPNLQVRQALNHATDRQLYTEIITGGKSPPADSWIGVNNPLRAQLGSAIPQYPYDVARAQRLLAEAGWVRGSDGILVHQPSGDRFEMVVFALQAADAEQFVSIIGDMWQAVGVRYIPTVIPTSLISDLEYRSMQPGAGRNSVFGDGFYGGRLYFHSREISAPANRWRGANRSGYQNSRVDSLLDRLASTINPDVRVQLHRDLLVTLMGDAPIVPLHLSFNAVIYRDNVIGIQEGLVDTADVFNIHEWDKK